MGYIVGNLTTLDIVFLLISVYFIYAGIRQLLTKDYNFFLKKSGRYTKESEMRVRVPMGICMLLFALFWFACFVFKGFGYDTLHNILRWSSLAFLVAIGAMFFTLKLKDEKEK